ncbi:site-specific integrase [Lactiplantibacillus sp. WILCCON 0030]|uniref:Site-specific integrase n=1 Tax=Lactiplantibacillus brownii TaxID=3069269 RepID=A0ABU1ABE5_9LACO|nr:site-specific integrase [Lactiplantibacillus brownii]MDQ7938231.1 site-specific integrase [Lactiplantibacillus brownii]
MNNLTKIRLYNCTATDTGLFKYHLTINTTSLALITKIADFEVLKELILDCMETLDGQKMQNVVINHEVDLETLLILSYNGLLTHSFVAGLIELKNENAINAEFIRVFRIMGFKSVIKAPNMEGAITMIEQSYKVLIPSSSNGQRLYYRKELQSDICQYAKPEFSAVLVRLFQEAIATQPMTLGRFTKLLLGFETTCGGQYLCADLREIYEHVHQQCLDQAVKKRFIYSQSGECLKIYTKNGLRLKVQTINFNDAPKIYQADLKKYIQQAIDNRDTPLKIYRRFKNASNTLAYLHEKEFLKLRSVDIRVLIQDLKRLKNKDNQPLYKRKTIQGMFSEMRLFFDYVAEIHYHKALPNPFRMIKFLNAKSETTSHEAIPEEVVNRLLIALQTFDLQAFVIFLTLIATGVRASEAIRLNTDDFWYNSKLKKYVLRFQLRKTAKQRAKNNEDSNHDIPISDVLAGFINQEIQTKELLRVKANTKSIFIRQSRARIIAQSTGDFQAQVNKCIVVNNITYHNKLWYFTTHQCRKTLATELLSNGTSLEQVSHILGHSEVKTTRQYYHDIRDRRLAQLDQEVFKMFQPDSRAEHITGGYLASRELNFMKESLLVGANPQKINRLSKDGQGFCARPEELGPCAVESCVNCPLLLTGSQKLDTWKKLAQQQTVLVNDLDPAAQGYDQQVTLLHSYHKITEKIEAYVKG